nr:hypothetical protein [Tanacetum cinerariifolium]
MSNGAIERMIANRVDTIIAAEQTATAAKAAEVAKAAAAAETTRGAATAGDARGSNNTGPAAGAGGPNVAGPTIGAVAMNAVLEVRGCSYKEYMNCQPINFKELAILCLAMVPTTKKLLERYVWGLPQPIQGNVTSFDPATIDEAMRMARRLMDQAVRAGTILVHDNSHNLNHNNNNNKRRWNDYRRGDNNPNNKNQNINHHNQQNRRQENARGYVTTATASAGGRGYVGNLPSCN